MHETEIKGYFNKALCINYAVKNFIKGDFFIFSDIDLVYENDYIKRIKKYINPLKPKRVIPGVDVTYRAVYSPYYEVIVNNSPDRAIGIAHGNGLIHKESFMKVRGYNEKFLGYSPEDDEFNQRIGKINKLIYDSNLHSAHIFHPAMNREYKTINYKIYNEVRDRLNKMPDKLDDKDIHLLQENKPNWGEIVKSENKL